MKSGRPSERRTTTTEGKLVCHYTRTGRDETGAAKLTRAADAAAPMEDKQLLFGRESEVRKVTELVRAAAVEARGGALAIRGEAGSASRHYSLPPAPTHSAAGGSR